MEAIPDAARIAQAFSEQKRPRVAIPFNTTDFDQFAGAYQGDTVITLSRNGGRFYAVRNLGLPSIHMAPRGPTEIFPESKSKFFARDGIAAQYSFTHDPLGRVNGLVFHQGGLERWFRRIDVGAIKAAANSVAARVRAGNASPGTQAALDRYIRAMQQNSGPATVSTGIKVRIERGGQARQVQSFGPLQSLSFKGVAPDGMDLFDATFAKGHVQWWIAPLTADGRIVWVGFARPAAGGDAR